MGAFEIDVTRNIHISAPTGAAVYATPTYARASGVEMIEDVRYAAMHVKPDGSPHYYAKRIYRRRSPDNGQTWTDAGELHRADPEDVSEVQRNDLATILDPADDILIYLYMTHEVDLNEGPFTRGNRIQRTQRTFYRLSHDGGRTWTGARQVIDERDPYDETNWAPGVTYGAQGARSSGQWVFLPDGTLVIGYDVMQPDQPPGFPPGISSYYINTIYAQARLASDRQTLDWRFGDMIEVNYPKSMVGCCEAALAWLGGERLFNTMRCQGNEAHGINSIRYTTFSEDGGMNWTEPAPLVYEDGGTVWTPASPHRFHMSTKTGRTYVLANILPGPVYGQTPRYPLTIAEFDTDRLCVLRDTVQVIQDLPEGAPESRRYTNFSMYEERGSGDLILQMPEQPKDVEFEAMTKPEDFTADCIRFRIEISG